MYTLCYLCGGQTPAEPDAEWIYCVHCYKRIAVDPVEVGELVTEALAREQLLEQLLRDCIGSLAALLMCPDLNLEGLEEVTLGAIGDAHTTLRAVHAALEKEGG